MSAPVRRFASKTLHVVHFGASLEEAYIRMRGKNIRHLPVADDEGGVVGLISDRDLQLAMNVQRGLLTGTPTQPVFDPTDTVADFMSWPVETILETATVADAAKLMIDKKISALLITRADEVVGIVTSEDLLRALLETTESAARRAVDTLESAFVRSPVSAIAAAIGNVGV